MNPVPDQRLDVHVLLRKENDAKPRNRRRRREAKVVCLEEEIHVLAELDPLTVRQRKKAVVVKHRIKTFNLGQPVWAKIQVSNLRSLIS